MDKKVYNLEFPAAGCCGAEVNIFGYQFRKVENYYQAIEELSRGKTTLTAYVDIPENEKKSVLDWAGEPTALKDIILLLSIFTGHDVHDVETDTVYVAANPREYSAGKNLRLSALLKVPFEININKVYKLIRTESWLKKYHNGWFLILLQHVFRDQPTELSFILCWTIWEHLFSILKQNSLTEKKIWRTKAKDKVTFLLEEYVLSTKLKPDSKQYVKKLVKIRDRQIHFGRFHKGDSDYETANLFMKLTDFITAKILELTPFDESHTLSSLNKFLHI